MPALALAVFAAVLAAGPARAQTTPPPTGAQVDFHGIVDRALFIYVPAMAARGVALRFVELHQHGITGSGNRDDAGHATLTVDDGYYTNAKITEDGFRFMVCHELSHIAGSAPHMEAPAMYDGILDDKGDLMISAEGQADYAAAAKCMRLVLEGQDHAAYVRAHGGVPAIAAAKCARAFADEQQAALCERVMAGGKNFLDSFARSFPSSFDAQAPAAEHSVLGEHPDAQCRLDTVVAGALCPVSPAAPVDEFDPAVGFCTSRNFPQGARPPCWFKE